jgi:hypothetical protein
VKKKFAFILCTALFTLLCACGEGDRASYHDYFPDGEPPEVLMEITVTTSQRPLAGVLYDNDTAKAFAEMLPLTVGLWDPAPGFAKAFDLPERIPDTDPHTKQYELGSLAYWYDGPSVAIIFQDEREETIVPVVPIGKITDDVSLFADYLEWVRVETVQPEEEREK